MPPGNDENLRDYKEKLGRSHYTLACQGCGLWVIWVLKTTINFEGAVILR